MAKSRAWPWAAVPALGAADPAFAHAPLPGLQGFYQAAPHVFEEPGALLLFLALCLWCATAHADLIEKRLALLLAALVAGSAIGILFPESRDIATTASLALAALLGVLVAAAINPLRWPLRWPAAAVTIIAGLVSGAVCAPDDGPLGAMIWSAAGAAAGFAAGSVLLIGLMKKAHHGPLASVAPVAGRVLAAWIAAAGLLSLTLVLQQP